MPSLKTGRAAITRVFLPFALTLAFLSSLLLFASHLKLCSLSEVSANEEDFEPINQLPSVCTDKNCRSDYVGQLHREDVYPIPAIRHILWKNESVSGHFANQLRTWTRIHPDWTYVLWRDEDLEPLVVTHFPGLLAKFRSLPMYMMRIDMIRYMILYLYGGVYADLDYSIVSSLDEFRRFHAVITREPEVHSLELMGLMWPPFLLANPAFMMAAPGHTFYHFATLALGSREILPDGILNFAGPIGLSEVLVQYRDVFPTALAAKETIYIPPSYSFYPYPDNKLTNSKSAYIERRLKRLRKSCYFTWFLHPTLKEYCSDLSNMDPVTDKLHPVFAIHDLKKTGAAYDKDGIGSKLYSDRLIDAREVIEGLKLGKDFVKG